MSVYLRIPRGDLPQVRGNKIQNALFDARILIIPGRHMDIPLLVSWLSARQSAPEGGLSGRTNKLVDGCYSHWVGGCWPLLESSLEGKPGSTEPPANSLFSREGLTRYILGCCQGINGGLRDKPGKYVHILSVIVSLQIELTKALGMSIHTTPATFWQG